MRFDLKINNKQKKERGIKHRHYKKDKNASYDFFVKKKLKGIYIVFSFVSIWLISAKVSGFKDFSVVFKIPLGFAWLANNFIPNYESLKYFPFILKTLLDTFLTAAASTVCASFFAFFFAILGSQTCGLNKCIKLIIKLSASFFRNIPLVAWAMLLLFSFKQNNFTGFLALFIVTFGHLLRVFKEMIDETASESFEAVRASGAPYISAVFQTIIPSTVSGLVSWILYAIENNVRDSALIGILTGTGIGFLFNLYFKSFRYKEAGLIIFVLVITVLIIDFISNKIRQALL